MEKKPRKYRLSRKTRRAVLRGLAVLMVAVAAGHFVQSLDRNTAPLAHAPLQPDVPRTALAAGGAGITSIEKVSAGGLAAGALPKAGTAAPVVSNAALLTEAEAPSLETPAAYAEASGLSNTQSLALGADAGPDAGPDAGAAVKSPAQLKGISAQEAQSCVPKMTLEAKPLSLIGVSVTSPCHAGQRVVLRHAGLVVAEKLDDKGHVALDLPALVNIGLVSALFGDASFVTESVVVAGADRVQRFAVQWMADNSFQLHAMENGATYGQPGHVWAEKALSVSGGYLMSLGNPDLDLPMQAQVYTWPSDGKTEAQPVIESVVTELTCGRELRGSTLSLNKGRIEAEDLTLAMPGCDALGDILVLNNLSAGVTLSASN